MATTLEINTTTTTTNNTTPTHDYLISKKNKRQSTFDSGYHSADDLSSPTTTNTTTTDSLSRRSSFSSFDSVKKQQQRLSYTTLKSANERIEYLEEQLKSKQENNDTIKNNVSIQIETFLNNRKTYNSNTDDSSLLLMGPSTTNNDKAIEKLNELKEFLVEYNIIISKDATSSELIMDKKVEIFLSTQIIENWINSATQHKYKPDLPKNVEESEVSLYEKKLKDLQIERDGLEQDKDEIEQLLDEVRKEMELMMEELNQVKLERQRYHEISQRYENDLKSSIESDQDDIKISALQSLLRESENKIKHLESDHKEQLLLKTKELELSERSVAELSLVMEVQKKQKSNIEMEQALRRTVAERDGELAKLTFELEKTKRQIEQLKLQWEKQMQFELKTRLADLEEKIENKYKKESDTFQLQISRENRNLTGKMIELELELEDLTRQHEQDTKKVTESQKQLRSVQEAFKLKEKTFKSKEKSYKENLLQLEQKAQRLDSEVLLLYSKNLKMASHLGELDT